MGKNNVKLSRICRRGIFINSKYFFKNHSATILSIIAACGSITSTLMAVKATPKALERLNEIKNNGEVSKREIINGIVPIYIPTALTCIGTIFCIFGANALNKRQQASLISAHTLLNESFNKYRKAVIDIYGEEADSKIKSEMAKKVFISYDGYSLYIPDIDSSEEILFFDFYSKRYFNATLASILNAQYNINRNLALRGRVSINEFYDFIGINRIENGDNIGWDMDYLMMDGMNWLDFENEYTSMDDGLECYIISALINPKPFCVIDKELEF